MLQTIWTGVMIVILTALGVVGCSPSGLPQPRSITTPSQAFPTPLTTSQLCVTITRVTGDATIIGNAQLSKGSQRVLTFQVACEGEAINILQDGQVSVICSNDRLLQLTGPVTLHLEPTACASGTPLPAGSYGRVALKADILAHSGSSLLELDTRDSEGYGLVPIILSPRNTVLGNPRPTIRWVAVTKVVDYQITLKSPENQLTIVIAADNIACKHEQRYQTNICSLPFPDHWPALTVEGSYFLSIGSRESIVGVWRISEELNTLTVFPSEKMAHMSAAVLDLSKTGDLVTVDLLTGDLYVREGFYESAIGVYERVRDSQPSPMVNVVLGNLYQTIKLYRFAFDRYTECLKQLESADSLPVRAAAEFGIGRISFANHQYTDALSHFQKAEKLYAVAGMAAEQAAATQAVAQAQERLTR